MNAETVVMKVPAVGEHVALLRTVVHYYAGRASFTLDQIDDMKMAVDESGVQLLKHTTGDQIVLQFVPGERSMEVRVSAAAVPGAAVIDDSSFSWQILRALTDELRVETADGWATVVLTKEYSVVDGGTA